MLRVGILQTGGMLDAVTTPDGTLKIVDGYAKELLQLVLQSLHMNYTIVRSIDGTTGSLLKNGSWTGISGMLQRNEIDIAFASLTVTLDRMDILKFSFPYTYRDHVFGTKMPPYLPTYYAMIRPFKLIVWIALLLTILILPLLFCLLSHKKDSYKYLPTFFNILAILLQESPKIRSCTIKEAILLISWILASMLLSSAYTSLVLASLTVPLRKPGVETIKELAEAIQAGTYTCTTAKGTYVLVRSLSTSPDRHQNIIAEHMERENKYLDLNMKVFADYLTEDNRALILARDTFDLLFGGEALVAKEPFETVSVAIATTKVFKYLTKIDETIHKIWASGIYIKNKNDYFFRRKLYFLKKKKHKKSKKKLDLKDLIAPFTILFCGYTFGILVLLTEIINNKLRRF